VHLPRFDEEFKRTSKLCVASYSNITTTPPQDQICAVGQENESRYGKPRKHMSFLSVVVIHPLKKQYIFPINILGIPQLTTKDIVRASDIYGLTVPYVRGNRPRRLLLLHS
jgi:hypothetical protein